MPRRGSVAALGGTFDRLHAGHRALLRAAFQAADEVRIGLTTDKFLADHPKPLGGTIRSYRTRRAALGRFVRENFPRRRFRIVALNDGVGRSTDPEVRVLVVSAETLEGGKAVNRARRSLGRPPARLVVVPLVMAEDDRPIASRRIRAGEIDGEGAVRTPRRRAEPARATKRYPARAR